MFDDTMDPNDAGLLEISRRLEAYADLRLSPSVLATISMRSSVMSAAHRRSASIAADVAREAAAATAHAEREDRASPTGRRLYRPAAAFMAASLALAMLAGTVYGAKAGGPFYNSRLWVEAANLPAGLVARAQAEAVRLDRRIAEVQQASSDGDAPAAEAALAAYSVIVAEAVQGAAGDLTATATIEISMTRHVVVLTGLTATVPAQARAAVQAALVSSSKVIEKLDTRMERGNAGQPTGSDTRGGGPGTDSKGSPRPKPAAQPERAAGDDVSAPTPVPSARVPHARDHDSPPPGQSRQTESGVTNGAPHPTSGPDASDGDHIHPGQTEESSAP
ncbi:MAG: hypothetical protein ACJ77O_04815 [Chloroflexota bacterium]